MACPYNFDAPGFISFLNESNSGEGDIPVEHETLQEDQTERDHIDSEQTKTESENLVEPAAENLEQMDYSDIEEGSSYNEYDSVEKERSKTLNKRLAMEVDPSPRQSPRLVAISKEIRRRNADRGFMPPPAKGAMCRRSVSAECANPTFTGVEEKRAIRKHQRPLGELTDTDKEILHEIADYSAKSDSSGDSHLSEPRQFHYMAETISQKATKHTPKDKKDVTVPKEVCKGPTKVQPFKFTLTNKAKAVSAKPFVSLAELNMKFFTKTPQRFRTRSTFQSKGTEHADTKLTVPHTPKLTARTRTRSNHYRTREEEEEEEIKEARKYQFKARPLSKNALKSPSLPVIAKKEPTVPTPFDIIDEKNLKKMIGEKMMGSASSVASLPHSGLHMLGKKSSTTVKPFSFEARDSAANKRKQEKLNGEFEDMRKMTEFHAQPMPFFESKDQGVPSAKPLPPTKVQPFNMQSETFRKSRLEEFKQKVKERDIGEIEKRRFKATQSVSTNKEPFVPLLPRRTLEDISAFELNTAKRAEEWEVFDLKVKHKEHEVLAAKIEHEERMQREEDEEVKRLRKEAVHAAQPVRHFKPVEIKHGVLPVTCPKSPNLITNRNRNKSQQ